MATAFEAAEKKIAQSVAINIAGGYAGTTRQDLTRESPFLRQEVGEQNPGFLRAKQSEAILAGPDRVKLRAPKPLARLPIQRGSGRHQNATKPA